MEADVEAWKRAKKAEDRDRVLGLVLTISVIAAFAYFLLGGRALDLGFMAGTAAPTLFGAARVAIFATAVAYTIGMGIGFLVGWARTLRAPPLAKLLHDVPVWWALPILLVAGVKRLARRVADFYVEVVRGTPLLIQISFFFTFTLVFAPAEWDIGLTLLFAGTLALTVNTGGYQGEIFRGGLQAIEAGQVEAARSIGFSRWGSMRHVVLPQALRLMIPPLTNEFIALYKASSLLFVIGIAEPTLEASFMAREFSKRLFEVFVVLTAVYLVVTVPLSRAVGVLERRYRIPGIGLGTAPREIVTLEALRKSGTGGASPGESRSTPPPPGGPPGPSPSEG